MHCIGAERAIAAVITLDTPGANYRAVWAMKRAFPNLRIFVRAHDIEHGVNLEKAGATAVVPETLEPSLQLSAALLAEANVPEEDITVAIAEFRRNHMSELTAIASSSGFSLGFVLKSTLLCTSMIGWFIKKLERHLLFWTDMDMLRKSVHRRLKTEKRLTSLP